MGTAFTFLVGGPTGVGKNIFWERHRKTLLMGEIIGVGTPHNIEKPKIFFGAQKTFEPKFFRTQTFL